jgi:transposase
MRRFVEGTDRGQSALFPECLEDWIGEDNPVRVIDVFADELDLAELGFSGVDPEVTGRPSYHPSVLLKLYIYGYLNRVQSSRRLEREAGRNVEVMWLTGRLVPDHKTIADFRRDNGTAIREVCARFIALCRTMGLLEACVAIDGSKFKAVNNRDKNFTRAKMDRPWRRSKRASRAICSSSTLPTGRSRPRRPASRMAATHWLPTVGPLRDFAESEVDQAPTSRARFLRAEELLRIEIFGDDGGHRSRLDAARADGGTRTAHRRFIGRHESRRPRQTGQADARETTAAQIVIGSVVAAIDPRLHVFWQLHCFTLRSASHGFSSAVDSGSPITTTTVLSGLIS